MRLVALARIEPRSARIYSYLTLNELSHLNSCVFQHIASLVLHECIFEDLCGLLWSLCVSSCIYILPIQCVQSSQGSSRHASSQYSSSERSSLCGRSKGSNISVGPGLCQGLSQCIWLFPLLNRFHVDICHARTLDRFLLDLLWGYLILSVDCPCQLCDMYIWA